MSFTIFNNIETFIVASVVLSGFTIAFWSYLGNRKILINKLFFCLVIVMLLNILFSYLSNLPDQSNFAIYWVRLIWVTTSLAIPFFYFFAVNFPNKIKIPIIIGIVMILFGIIFSYFSFFSNFIINGIEINKEGVEAISGPGMSLFYSFLICSVSLGLGIILKKYFHASEIEKQKIKHFILGIAIFVLSSVIFGVFFPVFLHTTTYSWLGDYSILFFIGFTAYATIKHHLFDVKLAVVRSVTYSLILVTLAGVYLIFALLFSTIFNRDLASPSQIVSGVIISLILVLLFQPIRRFFNKITNKLFYKYNYNTGDFFARLNSTLTLTTNLRDLLERVAYEIGNTLNSEQAFFFINTFDGHYVSAGTEHHRQLPKSDATRLEKAYSTSNGVIVASLLEPNDPIRRLMLSHRIELLLPLIQAGEFVGHLCLGEHRNYGYTARDMKVLDTISDELAIAIQNALAVQEIRELNSTLQQRIANATKELRASNAMLRQLDKAKDEFVSMASHQLRTPLTSVKGYISMVLEGDAGKVTDEQRHFLDEAFMSSERMVHLINDFLNVSRIQTGKFIIDKHSIDLSKVIEQEIDSLQPSALSRNLSFVYHRPKNFPIINVDEGKIRQVVMNFADNALYYSHENTKIIVSLSVEDNKVLFTVKDSGIGVPVGEQDQLFSKFYRASNARKQRPDGTGVGLYLAKKIIVAHDGEIVFESTEGKGSTFGFRLPIE